MTSEEFRTRLRESTSKAGDTREFNDKQWHEFEKRLNYFAGDVNDPKFYPRLRDRLDEMQRGAASPNRLFYVSTPASVAGPIIEGLAQAGLNLSDKGWTRIILEKPFGRDLDSALQLNEVVHHVFDEKNVYRIDHYLGKETVQNILVFRFGNSLFEPVWNRNYIDYVEITAAETVGVEGRGSFYEETGALRDMVANHLLQLLALTAMEPPIAFDADSVREQKVQVFRSIRPMTVDDVAKRTVRGQYGPGQADKTSPGIPRGAECFRQIAYRDLCCGRVPRSQLALGRRAVLHPNGQATDAPGLGNPCPFQTHAAGPLRWHAGRTIGAQRHHSAYPT